MAGQLPRKPGWYSNPEEPRSLLYWDGQSWTERTRSWPNWVSRSEVFEPNYEDLDRSAEGPAHPYEVRERVATGAWSREWFAPRRSRQPDHAWLRGAAGHPSLLSRPRGPQAPALLRPGRRPLIVMVCLMAMAVAVVLSSVAVMAPYETRGTALASDRAARSRFAGQAVKDCAATLPRYREALASGTDGPTIVAAVHQVDLLRLRLQSIRTSKQDRGPVEEWLETWRDFAQYEHRYAAVIGPAVPLNGRLVPRALSSRALLDALQARRQATGSAAQADMFGADLGVPACRLEPVPID